jgi:NtrC-family two-component system sensor histidine kinase KinB
MSKNKLLLYLGLPEMRPFWIILVPLLALIFLNFYFLSYQWGLFSLAISILSLVVIFFVSLRSARARFNLLNERNQIRAIIASFTDAIVAYESDFKITAFNRAAEELFGLKPEEVLGKIVSPEWVKSSRTQVLTQVLFPSLAPNVSWRTDGDVYPRVADISLVEPRLELTVTTVRILDSTGQIMGFFKIIKDRTRGEEILSAKSEFLTVAAHQMRTPLSTIKWTFESVINGDYGAVTDSQKEALNNGLISADRVLKLANDLLDTANIESGKFGYDFVQSDLISLVSKMIEGYLPVAGQHNIKIYLEPPPDGLEPFKFDPLRIKIVFQNLIENAIRYNVENGEVAIKLGKKPPYLELPKMFIKFFRASNVLKYETEGTGLGLYITRNIVKAHGGKIWVESTENRGTIFHFTLPLDEKLIPQRMRVSA